MPINKERERFAKEKLPFEIVSRDVVQAVRSPDALGIWVYLLTLPENWVPRREQIREHFSLGKDRYGKAMKELRDLGLVWDAIVRDGQGRIIEKVMTVQAITDEQRPHLCAGKPVSRETRSEGESGHLKNKISIKEKDIGRTPPKHFTPPTVSEVSDYFSERGADPAEAERFVDFYESKGWLVGKVKMKCWKSSVRNWIRGNKQTANPQPKPRWI